MEEPDGAPPYTEPGISSPLSLDNHIKRKMDRLNSADNQRKLRIVSDNEELEALKRQNEELKLELGSLKELIKSLNRYENAEIMTAKASKPQAKKQNNEIKVQNNETNRIKEGNMSSSRNPGKGCESILSAERDNTSANYYAALADHDTGMECEEEACNTDDIDEDNIENVTDKDLLRSGSSSPSESSSVQSLENTSLSQILSPTLAVLAAAGNSTAIPSEATSTINRIDALPQSLALNVSALPVAPPPLLDALPFPLSTSPPTTIALPSLSSSSSVLPSLPVTSPTTTTNISECDSFPSATSAVPTIPNTLDLTTSSYVATLSPSVVKVEPIDSLIRLKHKTSSIRTPPPYLVNSVKALNSGGILVARTSVDSNSASIPNLIDSHDDLEQSIPAVCILQPALPLSVPPPFVHVQPQPRHDDDEDDERRPSAERELASPRCQSRDSSSGGRCPSDDSNCSGNGSTTAPTPTSPVGITLPATLPPAAAAALLPPQSAAMAAYFNVAAAAAQQNRLLLGNPLAAAAGLVRAAQSPPTLPPLSASPPLPDDTTPALDFSTKRTRRDSDTDSKSDNDVVNLSKSSSSDNSPLDLSVGSRKRNADEEILPMSRKAARPPDYKQVVSPWNTPIPPYFAAAVAAASLSPKNPLPVDWNGKNKLAPNDATKALEKMSEMTRLGGPDSDLGARPPNNHATGGGGGRHSAWQSHWLNKGADAVKDVFKCVWCKQSFPTLASLTTHMKETQHCGVSVPPSGNMTPSSANQQSHHPHHHHHQVASAASSNSSASNKSDLNLLIKETMPLPRKLVRGQDVWLGKGAEQTRQILKCMWCGQSFRSLAEMTSHMQQTQHYTNIISQEQIISWKQAEDGKGGGPGAGASGGAAANANPGTNSTVSAVLTCKVCDQAFPSLKDLSNHMVKDAHYKEHIMRSITESGGRRRQTREKRKKSLPVRKLLELERAQHEFKNGEMKPSREALTAKITCEKCGDKIETGMFVEHIRQCVGGMIPSSPRSLMKSAAALSANSIIPPDSLSPLTPNSRDGRKSIGDESPSPASNRHISPHAPDISCPSPRETPGGGNSQSGSSENKMSSPSVLNAIEQLIEKSFDTRSRHGGSGFSSNSHTSAPLGSSILKRLGIDESVDYTKPLIDPQTMNLLRTYQQHHYPKRERSGSESSSVSDRGSSRLESLTPERKPDLSNHATPRQSPEKSNHHSENESEDNSVKVKKEPTEDEDSDMEADERDKIPIKKEPCEDGSNLKENECEKDLSTKRKAGTPCSMAPSPGMPNMPTSSSAVTSTPVPSPSSDRSITPRSTTASEKKMPSGSLTALTSMFDNLTGSNSTSSGTSEPSGSHGSSKKSSSHPLAALQQLCDKTETTGQNSRSGSTGALASNLPPTGGTASGAILAFSWACNDAVMTSDSIIKCAFCDTPFCSKGAYRHHLSKVHFVKDDTIADPLTGIGKSSSSGHERGGAPTNSGGGGSGVAPQKSNLPPNANSSQSPKSSIAGGSGGGGGGGVGGNSNNNMGNGSNANRGSPSGSNATPSSANASASSSASGGQVQSQPSSTSSVASSSSTAASPFEESPHSKFLKYTELAKQLSSKYV